MGKRLRSLSGLDALFLYLEAMGTPMHVASLIRLAVPAAGAAGFAATLREHLLARLQPLAMLRRVLVEAPLAVGHPMWQERADVDLGDHVLIRRLPAPGTARQLDALVARLHAPALDRSKPLWQIIIIEGLADGGCALYLQSHHALVDGQSGVQLTGALLDTSALPPARQQADVDAAPSSTASRGTAAKAALRATARQFSSMIRGVPEGLRRIAKERPSMAAMGRLRDSVWLAPRTLFNVQIEGKRSYASGSLPLAAVKALAKRLDASLNDVVMALVADGLRDYLKRRKQLPAESLIAAMPVSLRLSGDETGNEVSMVQCPLATDINDPLRRLQAIRAATREIKGRVQAFRGLIPTDFPGLAAPLWATGLSQLWTRGRLSERLPPLANLVVSNVPGPPIPLYVAGAEVLGFHPVSIITHGLGLNITLLSYNGKLEFGIVAAPSTLPQPEQLFRALARALDRLQAQVSAMQVPAVQASDVQALAMDAPR